MNRKRIGRALLIVALASHASLATPAEIHKREATTGQRQSMDEKEAMQLGKKLRGDVDRAYDTLVAAGKLRNQGAGRNYITDVVAPYIPAGTPFDRAEAILRAAGFDIQPRLPNRFLPDEEKYDERAVIDQYRPAAIGKTSVVVALRPRAPNDYSVVSTLVAEIVRTLP